MGIKLLFLWEQRYLCPECFNSDGSLKIREQRFSSGMTLELKHQNRTLLKVDAWYLILSSMLRSDPPFSIGAALQESVLTAQIEIAGQEIIFSIPQPPEFEDDEPEMPIYGQG